MRLPRVVALIGLVAALAVAMAAQSFNSFRAEPVAFSKADWHRLRADVDSSADPGCVLGPMAQSLLLSGHLNQKTAQYVLEQLGQPNRRQPSELAYALGQCHGWGWAQSELIVRLSEAQTVLAAEPRLAR